MALCFFLFLPAIYRNELKTILMLVVLAFRTASSNQLLAELGLPEGIGPAFTVGSRHGIYNFDFFYLF